MSDVMAAEQLWLRERYYELIDSFEVADKGCATLRARVAELEAGLKTIISLFDGQNSAVAASLCAIARAALTKDPAP